MHLYSFKVNYGHVKLKREEKRKRSRNKAVRVKKIVKIKARGKDAKVLIPYQQTVMVSAFCFVYLLNILPCVVISYVSFSLWFGSQTLLCFILVTGIV